MSAYLVVALDVQDREGFRAYQKKVVQTFKDAQGRVLAASNAERVEGATPRELNVMVEFPSLEHARAWYESQAYQDIIALREQSAPGADVMFVEGVK